MLSEVDEDTNEQEESRRIENVSLLSGTNKSYTRLPSWLSAIKNRLENNVWTKLAIIAFKEVILCISLILTVQRQCKANEAF